MKIKFSFRVGTGVKNAAHVCGCDFISPSEVEELGGICGFKLTSSFESKTNDRPVRVIQIMEPSDSPRLAKLLEEIEKRYGWKPSEWYVVPKQKRGEYFGLKKHVTFSKKEIEGAEYLNIYTAGSIANHVERTAEQVREEVFLTKGYKPKKTVALGCLKPFVMLAMRTDLKEFLEAEKMVGLNCPMVIGAKELWKLGSEIRMPRSKLSIINADGYFVPEEDIANWSSKEGWRAFDGGGFIPDQLRYDRSQIEKMGDFDIALSYEITGVGYLRANRRVIVSRRFREALDEFGVKGVKYAPVILED